MQANIITLEDIFDTDFVWSIEDLNDVQLCHFDTNLLIEEVKKMNAKLLHVEETSQIGDPGDIWRFYQELLSALYRTWSGMGIDNFEPDCNQLSYYLCHYIQSSDNDKAHEVFEFVKETFDCMERAYLCTLSSAKDEDISSQEVRELQSQLSDAFDEFDDFDVFDDFDK